MTQEDKNLLLKDLCARLPYEVKIQVGKKPQVEVLNEINLRIGAINSTYASIRPYLFPMSSMSEEQRKEYESLCIKEASECTDLYDIVFTKDYFYDTVESIDYLYKNHIDVRGLIPMGLALDATELDVY